MVKYTRTGMGWRLWKKRTSAKKWTKVDNYTTKTELEKVAKGLRKQGFQTREHKVKIGKYKKK